MTRHGMAAPEIAALLRSTAERKQSSRDTPLIGAFGHVFGQIFIAESHLALVFRRFEGQVSSPRVAFQPRSTPKTP